MYNTMTRKEVTELIKQKAIEIGFTKAGVTSAEPIDCATRTVTCPLHNWLFDIPTGQLITDHLMGASGSIPAYDVKLADGEVWVREKAS
jgi:nitrite reductase/ring-hydroxylating ferredoxin subunit